MKTTHIQKLNEAVFILRNFIEMSSQLLPFLLELKYAKRLTQQDEEDKENIIELYRNYGFEDETSIQLMDSNILQLIHETFDTMLNEQATKRAIRSKLKKFEQEHDRLRHNWALIEAN